MGNNASILPEETPSRRIHKYAELVVDESLNQCVSTIAVKLKPIGTASTGVASSVVVLAPANAYMPTVNMMPKMNFLANLTLKVDPVDQPKVAGTSDKLSFKPAPLPIQALAGHVNLKSVKSLRSFALQHRSRHENSYIPQETLVPRGLNKKTVEGRRSLTNVLNSSGNSHTSGSGKGIASVAGDGDSFNIDYDVTIDRNVIDFSIDGGGQKKKPMLQLKLDVANVDEDDWIQVSDDEENPHDDDKTAHKREKLSLNNGPEGSYIFTQSGTIFVNGFNEGGIRVDGIARDSIVGSRLNICDRVVVLCKLGSGASSVVYKALDLRDMRLVALKMVSVYERSKRRQMVRELSTLFQFLRQKRIDRPVVGNNAATTLATSLSLLTNTTPPATTMTRRSITESTGLYVLKEPREYVVDFIDAFSNIDEGGVALMIEYMDGGSLQDVVVAGGCDDEGSLASIAVQALTGLSFLHSCSQLHRDLKPGNFLITNRGDVKVGDFGILRDMNEPGGNRSRVLSSTAEGHHEDIGASEATTPANGSDLSRSMKSNDPTNIIPSAPSSGAPISMGSPLQRAHTFVGTATYMSPERIDGREYSYPSDVWAFGLSLLTVSLGRLPIDTKGGYWSILQSIRDASPPRVPDDGRFSPEYKDFISCCLQTLPERRWTCEQLLRHPFLDKARREETSSDEDIENGVQDFHGMISALHIHLLKLQTEMTRDNNTMGAPVKSNEESIDFELFFGALRNPSTRVSSVLRSVVLGEFLSEEATIVSNQEGLHGSVIGTEVRSDGDKCAGNIESRLGSLSVQLNVSIDRLKLELDKMCRKLDTDNGYNENLISTPKARR